MLSSLNSTALQSRDTASKPQPKRIVATGNASSYYQVAANNAAKTIPNINYVKGKAITVLFENREVRTVEVIEQATGVYIEPGNPQPTTPGDAKPRVATADTANSQKLV